MTIPEVLLYVWIASFAYDEFADWIDAGQTSFYASDFWYDIEVFGRVCTNITRWTWDISIVAVGMTFCVLSKLLEGCCFSWSDVF